VLCCGLLQYVPCVLQVRGCALLCFVVAGSLFPASRRCLVVLLVDLLDASGSLLPHVRDLVGANPIILVGTKSDLLPAGTKVRCSKGRSLACLKLASCSEVPMGLPQSPSVLPRTTVLERVHHIIMCRAVDTSCACV
jgi:GTPase SAR1 family protein